MSVERWESREPQSVVRPDPAVLRAMERERFLANLRASALWLVAVGGLVGLVVFAGSIGALLGAPLVGGVVFLLSARWGTVMPWKWIALALASLMLLVWAVIYVVVVHSANIHAQACERIQREYATRMQTSVEFAKVRNHVLADAMMKEATESRAIALAQNGC
jgi:hypothetical protein